MGAAGAGARNREVDTLKAENDAQVHGNGGIHGLEDGTAAAEHGVVLFDNLGHGLKDRIGRAVVAVKQTHFMAVQIILVYTGLPEGIPRGAIGVLGRFRHIDPLGAGEFFLEFRFGYGTGETGTEAHGLALRVKDNSGFPFIEGIPHLVQGISQAGPDAHARYDDSLHHE